MNKTLYISRGISGVGKSFEIKKYVPKEHIFSTDDFWGPNYDFNPSLLGHAHTWNQQRTKEAMEQGISPLGVDNTSLTWKEIKPYAKLAKLHGYEIEYVESTSPWWLDMKSRYPWNTDDIEEFAAVLDKKNQHGVPIETLKRMLQRWTPTNQLPQQVVETFKNYFIFKEILTESFSDNAYVFDLDQTILETDAQIIVKDENNNIIKKLTPAEYNTYQKQPGEKFDFSEFESPELFHQTATPIKYFKVIKNISDAIKEKRSNSFIYILTARGTKVKNAIYGYLKDRGVEVRPIEIHTIGDTQEKPIADKKKEVLQQIRDKHIGKVIFFDDDQKNVELAQQVHGVEARLVK
jgi:hypothetical protein